jgi:large subunit ribosomal protein L10
MDEIMALAELPSKETLQAQALGMMLAPITSLAIVLKAIAEKDGAPAEEAAAE